ncbi:MAG TPA: hypothetical protein VGF14_07455 [Alphaproteobacteria bacterium]
MSLSDLENTHDGVIPFVLRQHVLAGGYLAWQQRIARAAECNFHGLILHSLGALAAWRMRHPGFQVRRQLKNHSQLLGFYRHKACEAFDLFA